MGRVDRIAVFEAVKDLNFSEKRISSIRVSCPQCDYWNRISWSMDGQTMQAEDYCRNYINCEQEEFSVLDNIESVYLERKVEK